MARAGIKLKTYAAMPGCTLGTMRASGCIGKHCDECGWDSDEMARRREQIQKHGLTVNPMTGLSQLFVGKGNM